MQCNEEQFSIADSGYGGDNRILIFDKKLIGDWAHLVHKVYFDGTFIVSPDHFAQVFVIMGERGGFAIPLAYARPR